MIIAIFALLIAAALGFGYRLARGPSIIDRVIAMDGLVVTGVAVIVTDAVNTENATFIPVAVVATLVGFVGTAVVARYVERRDS